MSTELAKLDLPPDILEKLSNPLWRLTSLYTIVDRHAQVVPFYPNDAQHRLLSNLHYRNLILKARQRGFSTLVQLAALDQVLWHDNFTAGIIADNLDNAGKFLERIEFAYNKLPEEIRFARSMEIERGNTSSIHFANGSTIHVDTSYRSGSLQFLHVSEFGKICARYPDKAREIVTGSIPALSPQGMLFIESTAEGNSGYFHDMTQDAMTAMLAGRKLTPLELKFFFFSWYDEQEYQLNPDDVVISVREKEYFDAMERETGEVIDPPHRAWYVVTKALLGDDMKREHPTTPKEAFEVSIYGQYYAYEIAQVREARRYGKFPYVPGRPVYTFWDIGANDMTAIWCMQYVGSRLRFILYMEDSGKGYDYYMSALDNTGWVFGTHYLPHDAAAKRQSNYGLKAPVDMLRDLKPGANFEIVERIADVMHGIKQTRLMFPICEFDEEGCKLGFQRLADHRKEWNERTQTWKDTPYEGPEIHGADAFRQAGQLYDAGLLNAPPPYKDKTNIKGRARSWATV